MIECIETLVSAAGVVLVVVAVLKLIERVFISALREAAGADAMERRAGAASRLFARLKQRNAVYAARESLLFMRQSKAERKAEENRAALEEAQNRTGAESWVREIGDPGGDRLLFRANVFNSSVRSARVQKTPHSVLPMLWADEQQICVWARSEGDARHQVEKMYPGNMFFVTTQVRKDPSYGQERPSGEAEHAHH